MADDAGRRLTLDVSLPVRRKRRNAVLLGTFFVAVGALMVASPGQARWWGVAWWTFCAVPLAAGLRQTVWLDGARLVHRGAVRTRSVDLTRAGRARLRGSGAGQVVLDVWDVDGERAWATVLDRQTGRSLGPDVLDRVAALLASSGGAGTGRVAGLLAGQAAYLRTPGAHLAGSPLAAAAGGSTPP